MMGFFILGAMGTSRYHDPYLATLGRPVRVRGCDCAGCDQAGDYRAPKAPDQLTDYYWFCLDHVRAYNAAWDFFAGKSEAEIEGSIRKATVWERPSWPMGEWQKRENELRDTVAREFFSDGDGAFRTAAAPPMTVGEREALATLELAPPVDFTAVKAQYRLLVKRWHPDANGGAREAEEKFKTINHAFATLRAIYEGEAEGS